MHLWIEKGKKPKPSFDEDSSDEEKKKKKKVVTLTEEHRRLISDYNDRFQMSGGFYVPKIPPHLLRYVIFPIQPEDIECSNFVMKVVNRGIRHYNKNKKKKKMEKEKDEVGDLVLVEILSYGGADDGPWSSYITFKAKDSSGAIRTYETLMSSIFRGEENEKVEIFRVKPYTRVECG